MFGRSKKEDIRVPLVEKSTGIQVGELSFIPQVGQFIKPHPDKDEAYEVIEVAEDGLTAFGKLDPYYTENPDGSTRPLINSNLRGKQYVFTKVISETKNDEFQDRLNKWIRYYQAEGHLIEVQFSTDRTFYDALILGYEIIE